VPSFANNNADLTITLQVGGREKEKEFTGFSSFWKLSTADIMYKRFLYD
jgi:hypothetical protein